VPFKLRFAPSASATLKELKNGDASQRAKLSKINRALGRLETNPRHPGLNSYPYENFPGVSRDVKVWHSYVENNTPSAWRIFWRYGPNEGAQAVITVLAITPHT
jgi:hypothetical protein